MTINKWHLLIISLLIISLLTGCWNKRELTDIAIVAAIGIDKNPDGGLIGSFQIINPNNVAGNLQGGSGGSQAPPTTTYEATGHNLMEISRQVTKEVSREIYYGHTNIIVIGEELAKEDGLFNIMDVLDRNIEFRTSTLIVISHGVKAKDLLETITPIDNVPSRKMLKTLTIGEQKLGEISTVNVQSFIKYLITEGKEPVIPGFKIRGSQESVNKLENIQKTKPDAVIEVSGLAIFKDGKLIDWFQNEIAFSTQVLLGTVKQDYANIDWEDKKAAISYQGLKQSRKLTVEMKDGRPYVKVNLKSHGDIGEVTVPIDLNDRKVIKKIEKKVEEEYKKNIEQVIKRAKELKSDIFGFGEELYRSDPKKWKEIKHEWNEKYFPEAEVDIEVTVKIHHTGLRSFPFIKKKEK